MKIYARNLQWFFWAFMLISCQGNKTDEVQNKETLVLQDFADRCTANLNASETTFSSPNSQIELPWNASVKITLSDASICSGVILTGTKIITAAHCFEQRRNVKAIDYNSGSRNGNKPFVLSGDDILRVALHPVFKTALESGKDLKSDIGLTNYDVAILTLARELKLKQEFFPKIARGHEFSRGKLISIVGYGDSGSGPGKQRFAQSHVGQDLKQGIFLGNTFKNLILLDSTSGTGACPGDSGGGGFVKNTSGEFELVGIVQGINDILYPGFPVDTCKRCPKGLGIISSLYGHLNFLSEQQALSEPQ